MPLNPCELDVIALLEDLPQHRLRRGQVGTLVVQLGPGVFEAEFSDDLGRTYALVSLAEGQFLNLISEPAKAA
jgi:hypothetical protein